jgi:hypothetical protein
MAAGIPTAEILHTIEGRTRLRFALQADAPGLAVLAGRLLEIEGVIAVRARPLTGTVLVKHEGSFAPIATRAKTENLFVLAAKPAMLDRTAMSPGALPAAGALAMGTIGVFQLLQERILPPAITLFWYALTLAREARAADQTTMGGDSEDDSD